MLSRAMLTAALAISFFLPAAARADDNKVVLPLREVPTRAGTVYLLDRSKPEVKIAVEGKEAFPFEKKIITLHRYQVRVKMKAEVSETVRERFNAYPDIAQSQRLIGCFVEVKAADGTLVDATLKIVENTIRNRNIFIEFVPPKGEFVVTCYHILKLNDLTDAQRDKTYEAVMKDDDMKKIMGFSDVAKERQKDNLKNPCMWIAREVKKKVTEDKGLRERMQMIDVCTATYIGMDTELRWDGHASFIIRSPKGLIFFDSTQQVTGHFDTQEAITSFGYANGWHDSRYPAGSAEHTGMTLLSADFQNDAVPDAIKAAKEIAKLRDTVVLPDLKKAAEKDKTLKPLIDPPTK
jgi:hypothetical protein